MLSRLLFPALVAPAMTTWTPLRSLSPRLSSFRWPSTSLCRAHTHPSTGGRERDRGETGGRLKRTGRKESHRTSRCQETPSGGGQSGSVTWSIFEGNGGGGGEGHTSLMYKRGSPSIGIEYQKRTFNFSRFKNV